MKKSYKIILFVVVITVIIIVNFNTTLNLSSRAAGEAANSRQNRIKHNNNNRNNKSSKEENEFLNPIDKEIIDNQGDKKQSNKNNQNNQNNNNNGIDDIDSEFEDSDSHNDDKKSGGIFIGNSNNDLDEKNENNISGSRDIELVLVKPEKDWEVWKTSSDGVEEKKQCHYSNQRDYDTQPVHVITDRYASADKNIGPCDIPCVASDKDYVDASVYSRSQCSRSVYTTLENVSPFSKYDITSTTSLKSDVPIGYYSWHEYPYYKKPSAKVVDSNTGLVAAFITNCGPVKRLEWLRRLQESGVKVDSYGNCAHNKDISQEEKSKLPSDYNGEKMGIMSRYKFAMAFENSNTDDYVTEKLFGVLTIGSVPIYDGAPNARDFLPQPDAAILASDYESPEDLAKYLLYLNGNDTAYNEHLNWKKQGPTDEWMSIVDNSLYSQECRTCIHVADMQRKDVGRVLGNSSRVHQMNLVPKTFTKKDGIVIYVRERFKFWFYAVAIPFNTSYKELNQILLKAVPHKGILFQAYDLESKDLIISSKINSNQIINLKQEQEIELVFVNRDFFWNSYESAKDLKNSH